jgi:hypothetical protein
MGVDKKMNGNDGDWRTLFGEVGTDEQMDRAIYAVYLASKKVGSIVWGVSVLGTYVLFLGLLVYVSWPRFLWIPLIVVGFLSLALASVRPK